MGVFLSLFGAFEVSSQKYCLANEEQNNHGTTGSWLKGMTVTAVRRMALICPCRYVSLLTFVEKGDWLSLNGV